MKRTRANIRASKVIGNAALAMAVIFGSAAAVAGSEYGKNLQSCAEMSDTVVASRDLTY